MTVVIIEKAGAFSERKILGKTVLEHIQIRLNGYFDKIFIADGELDFNEIKDEKAGILVLQSDMPLINEQVVTSLLEFHMKNENDVSRIGNSEGADCGAYFFKPSVFYSIALSEGLSDIDTIISAVKKRDVKTGNTIFYDPTPFTKADSVAGFYKIAEMLKIEINYTLAERGVQFIDLSHCYIDIGVEIGTGTVIYPNTIIEGESIIGENCVIGPESHLTNMKIGNGSKIVNTVAMDSEIGENTATGPFAYIRPHCKIGNSCKVGDFVEVKNSVIGDGTKASHLTYLGDADIGSGINFGCGTVIVNYDGKNKFRTVIEDDCFIGCNANLISPVTLGKGSFIAAGSTITEDVPENALGIARAKQVNKEGWERPKKIEK